MPQLSPSSFTQTELQDIANDPRLTNADRAHFTPEQWGTIQSLKRAPGQAGQPSTAESGGGSDESSILGNVARAIGSVGVGAFKGTGSSVVNVGQLAHKVPVIKQLMDTVGLTDQDLAFREKALQPEGTAESIGHGAEQIGEFMLPAGAARKGAIKGLARLIPDAASPATMKTLNKVAAITGRSLGEGASAAAVSTAHGENPDVPAAIGAGAPLVGAGVSAAIPPLVQLINQYPIIASMFPWLVGGAVGTAAGGIPGLAAGAGGGLGAQLALRGAARGAVREKMHDPKAVKRAGEITRRLLELLGRTSAATSAPVRKQYRTAMESE